MDLLVVSRRLDSGISSVSAPRPHVHASYGKGPSSMWTFCNWPWRWNFLVTDFSLPLLVAMVVHEISSTLSCLSFLNDFFRGG